MQIAFLKEHPDIYLLGTSCTLINENGEIIKNQTPVIEKIEEIRTKVLVVTPVSHPTWMFKREIIDRIGSYRDFKYAQDYDFLLRIISSGFTITNLKKPLVKYRTRTNSISTSKYLLQLKFAEYAKKLFLERKTFGKDSYSQEYINRNILNRRNIELANQYAEFKGKYQFIVYKKSTVFKKVYLLCKEILANSSYLLPIMYVINVKLINRIKYKFKRI
jgi:hypothetical protein